ncbi:MAG: DUF3109 family protein [Dehalococcoidia bacterium]|nr:DUF3109 family protein [Dehalococcoidia bacterium]
MIEAVASYLNISIKAVDENLFTRKYSADCLGFLHCEDICCSYGCDVDKSERDRILACADKLEPRLGIPASGWFDDEMKDEGYPSGFVVRTRVYRHKCVFHDRKARGCLLHHFANDEGIDWRRLKPMVCTIFPVTWEKGRLLTSPFLDELPCNGCGECIFDAQKRELREFFGDRFGNLSGGGQSQTTTDRLNPDCMLKMNKEEYE